MRKLNFNLKFISILLASIVIFAVFLVAFYLYVLPKIMTSKFATNSIEKLTHDILKMELVIDNPKIKTSLKPLIECSVDSLLLTKNNEVLVSLDGFSTSISYNKIFQKEIKLNYLKANSLIVMADKLIENLPVFEKKENQKPSDFRLNIYNSEINLNELEVSYKQNKALIDLYSRDISIVEGENCKNLVFNLMIDVYKNTNNYLHIVSSSTNEVKIYEDKIKTDDLRVLLNKSDLLVNSEFKLEDLSLNLNAKSRRFFLKDIFNIINSDVVILDGEKLLSPLANPSGYVSFDVNMKNNSDLSGVINITNAKASIKDLSNLPLNIQKGKIIVYKDKIDFKDLVGYYGKNKANSIKIFGDIKDYYKTFDSNLIIDTVVTNEFFKDYLAKLINNTVLFTSKSFRTAIVYKSKNNIMDITWLAKIPKKVNFGLKDTKSALSDYDRAIKGDFHIENNNLEIKNINYYIASDIKRGVKIKPIVILDGKMALNGKIDNLGFKFDREIPCEFLNIFTKQKTFKKGTMIGSMHVMFKNDIPYLNADMKINKTFLPYQRMWVKNAVLKTTNDNIWVYTDGIFKRVPFVFKGKIKNELKAPFTINNLVLELDKLNIERVMASFNNGAKNQSIQPKEVEIENPDEIADDDYMFDTNLIRIENADFIVKSGNYKELQFANVKANLTLDEKGILNIKSNRFDIADGISSLAINCDLVNLLYSIKLGAKDVDSNLMAKVLLNLDKEITGKASGLIELNTDKSLKLNGKIQFLVNEGTIGKIGLVEYVLKIASVFRNPIVMISPGTIMDIVSIPEGKFDKITGQLLLKDNVVTMINIKSYSDSLSALIRGRFDMERHDASLRIYTRFSSDKKSAFGFLRNLSLNRLANKVKMNTRNDANYYASELADLPPIAVKRSETEVFLTQVEGDVEHNNFISSLKKIK